MTITQMTKTSAQTLGVPSSSEPGAHRNNGAAPAAGDPQAGKARWFGRLLKTGPGLIIVLIVIALVGRAVLGSSSFPSSIRIPLDEWLDAAISWITANGAWLFTPLADQLNAGFDVILEALVYLPALTIALSLVAVTFCLAGWRMAIFASLVLLYVVAASVWDETLQTLVILLIAVVICCIIGVAIGVVAAADRRLNVAVTTVLDGMQSFPTFAYLVPVVAIFGTGIAAAIVVTIIWAVPPIARMTAVGLSTVSPEILEAARSCGATRLQLLRQVRLPLAQRSITAGVNQTIMFSMTMATIAVLIGAPGLGAPVWSALGRLEFGQALQAGLALVLVATLLDRTSMAFLNRSSKRARDDDSEASRGPVFSLVRRHAKAFSATGVVVACTVVIYSIPDLLYADFTKPPAWMKIDMREPVSQAVDWMTANWSGGFDLIRNTVQERGLSPITSVLHATPWEVVVIAGLLVGMFADRIRGAVVVAGGIMLIGAFGLWDPTIDTLAVCGVAVIIALAVAFPIGVVMSRSDAFAAALRPFLDLMQTLPIFLFVIPTVVLLGSGSVAGTLATTLYAIPVMVRLTNVALRDTAPEVIEAATSAGATPKQILLGVRVPLGMPTLLVGVNQTILLALSMVVVSAFIGTPGLGEQILTSVTWAQAGLGIEAGVAMFLLAIMTDRVITGLSRRSGAAHHLKSR